MAKEYNGIIAGISVDNENQIQPEFDASIYDFIIGQNGHDIDFSFSHTGQQLFITANGFAIADGVRAFFDNEVIVGGQKGFVYVDFAMNHIPNIPDTVELKWSDIALTEEHTHIGTQRGHYLMKVLEITPAANETEFASGKIVNQITYPKEAHYADEATVVTKELANGVTAVTQKSTDSSERVATTEFVHILYDAIMGTAPLESITLQNLDAVNINNVSLKKKGNYVQGRIQISALGLLDESQRKIATLPAEYCPKQAIETAAGVSGNNSVVYLQLAPNGDVSLAFTGQTNIINIDANIGYETP